MHMGGSRSYIWELHYSRGEALCGVICFSSLRYATNMKRGAGNSAQTVIKFENSFATAVASPTMRVVIYNEKTDSSGFAAAFY